MDFPILSFKILYLLFYTALNYVAIAGEAKLAITLWDYKNQYDMVH